MTTEPRKSFGFLTRAMAFELPCPGPRFKVLPPPIQPKQPEDGPIIMRRRPQRDFAPIMRDERSAILDGFVERQRTREERRRMRAERAIGEFRPRGL